jgi:hypothetical protein
LAFLESIAAAVPHAAAPLNKAPALAPISSPCCFSGDMCQPVSSIAAKASSYMRSLFRTLYLPVRPARANNETHEQLTLSVLSLAS